MKKEINPVLTELAFLVGKWDMKISNASFLPSSSEVVEAPASFEWYESGEFIVLRQGTEDTPHATWIIGHDQDAQNYTVLYFDDRHVSRVYEMSFENDAWKMWRNGPEFMQSFEGKVSDDKNTIAGAWSKSKDGKKWEHDFDLTYSRKED
jgi:hypothetical protein